MEYGLIVKVKELDILDENEVDYYLHDAEDFLLNGSSYPSDSEIEIDFEEEATQQAALKILKMYR